MGRNAIGMDSIQIEFRAFLQQNAWKSSILSGFLSAGASGKNHEKYYAAKNIRDRGRRPDGRHRQFVFDRRPIGGDRSSVETARKNGCKNWSRAITKIVEKTACVYWERHLNNNWERLGIVWESLGKRLGSAWERMAAFGKLWHCLGNVGGFGEGKANREEHQRHEVPGEATEETRLERGNDL